MCNGPSASNRILFLLAGTFTLTGTVLAVGVSPWFSIIPVAVAANQLLFFATGRCPASMLLGRLCSAEAATEPAGA